MPIIKRELGGGITRRIATTISAPFGDKEIEAFAAEMKRLGAELAGWLTSSDAAAGKILADARLPTTFDRYWRADGGEWALVTGETSLDSARWIGVHFVRGVWGAAKADGYEHDSKVGFAARAIDQAGWIRHYLERGEAEKACLASMRLGEILTEARIKEVWQPTVDRGQAFAPKGRSPGDLARLVDEALQSLGLNASANQIYDFVQRADLITCVDADGALEWDDSKGREHTTSRRRFDNLVSVRRKNLKHQITGTDNP